MPLSDELFEQFDAMQIRQHPIVWDKELTAKKIKELRENNANLARYACKYSRLYKLHNYRFPSSDVPCRHTPPYSCADCYEFHKRPDGTNDVSTRILSNEKGLSTWRADQISALESGRDLTLEKVFFYAYLAQVPLSQILVLAKGYTFDSNGIIVKSCDELE